MGRRQRRRSPGSSYLEYRDRESVSGSARYDSFENERWQPATDRGYIDTYRGSHYRPRSPWNSGQASSEYDEYYNGASHRQSHQDDYAMASSHMRYLPTYSSPTPFSSRYNFDEARYYHSNSSPNRMSSPTQEVNPNSLPPRIWDPPLDPQDRKSPRPKTPPPPSNRPPQEPPAAPEFVPGSPTPSYIEEVLLPPAITPKIEVKLLILDLNGTLGYRKRSNQTMNPRPYLGSFADYVTHWKSGLETMVWSSAKPHNVDKMVKRCFGRRKLRAVWARDTLGLNTDDYNRKVQTVKDLKIVWKGLENHNFSASNTILLDDSSIKAHMQPYNHVVLKEYDEVLCAQDQCARSTESVDNDSLDQTLLAVIGILHEAVRYDNVGSWIRSGGLWAGLRDISALPPGTASAGNGERAPAFAQQDVKVDNMIAESVEHSAESTLGNNIWYQDPDVLQTWITRGIAALKEFKIPIRP